MPPADAVPLIDRLATLYPEASRRTYKQWLQHGRVRVDDRVVRRAEAPIAPDARVRLGPAPPPSFPTELGLVHEDDSILVVDKPPGLLTIATEKERERTAYRLLSDYLAGQSEERRHRQPLFIVHRLDRETSGVLVFAKSPEMKRALQAQFERRAVERVYVAIVEGRVPDDSGTLRDRLREDRSLRVRPAGATEGREAITHYRVLARRTRTTRLELRLETGRRAQIRAQLAALGHPVVGDRAYGSRDDSVRRVCLHATRLGFVGAEGRTLRFESPVPKSFSRVERASGHDRTPPSRHDAPAGRSASRKRPKRRRPA